MTRKTERIRETYPGFASAFDSWIAATENLASAWEIENVPGDAIRNYPASLPSFDEFAAEVAGASLAGDGEPFVYPSVGTRVRLHRDVDRYPHFVARAGATGVVTEINEKWASIAVRLTETLRGAESWDNEVWWEDSRLDEFWTDVEILVDEAEFCAACGERLGPDDDAAETKRGVIHASCLWPGEQLA